MPFQDSDKMRETAIFSSSKEEFTAVGELLKTPVSTAPSVVVPKLRLST